MKLGAPGDSDSAAHSAERGTFPEVLGVFLKLGVTSGGGPIALLGYVRAAFVESRRGLAAGIFVDVVGLAQFLRRDQRRARPGLRSRADACGLRRGSGGLAWLHLAVGASDAHSPSGRVALRIRRGARASYTASRSSPWRLSRRRCSAWRRAFARIAKGRRLPSWE